MLRFEQLLLKISKFLLVLRPQIGFSFVRPCLDLITRRLNGALT